MEHCKYVPSLIPSGLSLTKEELQATSYARHVVPGNRIRLQGSGGAAYFIILAQKGRDLREGEGNGLYQEVEVLHVL